MRLSLASVSALRSALILTALLAALTAVSAQDPEQPPGETTGDGPGFAWRAELPGGAFMVSLAALRHVSVHEYLVPGVGKITELTIDAGGSVAARFYAVSPPDIQAPSGAAQSVLDRAKEVFAEARDRADPAGLSRSVIKDYPNTTHAHTVEYLLSSPEAVRKLHQHLEDAWTRGRGASIKIE